MKLSRFLLSLLLALFLGNTAPLSFKSPEKQAALPSIYHAFAGALPNEQVFPRLSDPQPEPTPGRSRRTVDGRQEPTIAIRQMLAELARWLEPWEVHSKEGYLVVGVTQAEYDQLLKLGFRVEIDRQLTDQANRPIQRLPQQTGGIPGFPCYRTVAETYDTAQTLVSAFPQLAAWIDIGDSLGQSPVRWRAWLRPDGFTADQLQYTRAKTQVVYHGLDPCPRIRTR